MELRESICTIYPLGVDELDKIVALAERIKLPKRSIFIDHDRIGKYIYILEKGICRIYYPKEEKEVILDFCFPGTIMLPLNSYVHGAATYEIADTLTPCFLHRIAIDKLQHLYETSLPISNWGRKLAEIETLKIEDRLVQSLFKTAAERYQDLLKKAPLLLQHIKLGYIATYLGISQVTLSRIRAEIK